MGDVTYIYFEIITEFQGMFFSTELQSADKHTKYQKTSHQYENHYLQIICSLLTAVFLSKDH